MSAVQGKLVHGAPPIPTMIKPAEAEALRLAAVDADVLEIGSAWGFSTVLMAQVARRVVSVDPHTMADTWVPFLTNLERYKVRHRVWPIHGPSQEVLPHLLTPPQFDMVFVDGDHTHAAASHDIGWALIKVRAGGIIAVHDYCVRWPGVLEAVDQLLGHLPAWRIQDLYLAVSG